MQILVYVLGMPNEASLVSEFVGTSFSFWINCDVFFMLLAYDKGIG
jgi:hypothetical protein